MSELRGDLRGDHGTFHFGGAVIATKATWSFTRPDGDVLEGEGGRLVVDHTIFGEMSRTFVISYNKAARRFFRRWSRTRASWLKPQRARYPSDGGRRRR